MTTTPPVIFIIFNRLDTAKQVFEAIKAARPKTLLVIADGPVQIALEKLTSVKRPARLSMKWIGNAMSTRISQA